LLASLLAALALLGAAGSVAAHPAATAPALTPPPSEEIVVPPAAVPLPLEASDSTSGLWGVAAGALVLVGLIAVARRRPRRVLATSLVLLLTVFVFENALHSVHHGFDPKQHDECAVAAAAAQLTAVPVDGIVETAVDLAITGTAVEPALSFPSIRRLGPDQDRAPPVPTV
jgi:hypothetical protein